MKIFQFIAIILTALTLSLSGFAKTNAKNPAKDIKDIKTFDFERIFAETGKYFKAAKSWKKIKCYAKSGFVCTKHECPKLQLVKDAHLVLDRESEILSLCKNKVCKYYQAEFKQTGVFVTIRVKDSDGIFIRVLGDSRFKEISMIGLDAYISNGVCEPAENK